LKCGEARVWLTAENADLPEPDESDAAVDAAIADCPLPTLPLYANHALKAKNCIKGGVTFMVYSRKIGKNTALRRSSTMIFRIKLNFSRFENARNRFFA
jgi:hypothetical protein